MDRGYFAYVMSLKTLSRDDEFALMREFKTTGSQRIKDKIVAHFMKLVISRANAIMGKIGKKVVGSTLDDLINDGVIGLLTAIEKFDIDMISANTNEPIRLSTYADQWIKVVIFGNAMRRKSMVYNLGSGKMKSVYFKLPKIVAEKGWEGQKLTHDMAKEIAAEISHRVTPEEVLAMEMLRAGDLSLDAKVSGEAGIPKSMLDLMVSSDDVEDEVYKRRLDAAIREELMACCDDREREVLESRMFSDDKKTLQELADGMGVSKVKIKQMEKEAGDRVIQRLRNRFEGSFGRRS